MDKEKVIRSVDRCVIKRGKCHECDYYTQTEQGLSCRNRLLMDALAMLNEQEVVVHCKDCKYGQYCTDGETTYQCYKWNSGEFGVLHEQDWFCADGERK